MTTTMRKMLHSSSCDSGGWMDESWCVWHVVNASVPFLCHTIVIEVWDVDTALLRLLFVVVVVLILIRLYYYYSE